jgi:molecular chaperone DnaK
MASDNKSLGRFILDGVPPAPRGMPQVEVSFDVDVNGILNVTAKDKASGKTQSIKIEASSGLKEEEIKKMQQDAELHAEEDKIKRELVDVKNTAEMIFYTAEKALKDNDAKIPAELKDSVNAKMNNLKTAKEGTDLESIKKATEELSSEMSKMGEAVQKANATDGTSGANPDASETSSSTESKIPEEQNPEIRDAEFKEGDKPEEGK